MIVFYKHVLLSIDIMPDIELQQEFDGKFGRNIRRELDTSSHRWLGKMKPSGGSVRITLTTSLKL